VNFNFTDNVTYKDSGEESADLKRIYFACDMEIVNTKQVIKLSILPLLLLIHSFM
jgi:hypothetical protein